MHTRVQMWANSLGVRIPRGLAEQIGLGAGTEVSLSAKDGELVVKTALQPPPQSGRSPCGSFS